MALPTCDVTGCTGHLGKYDDCVSEALDMDVYSYADETTGESDAPCGYNALHLVKEAYPMVLDDGHTVTVPPGNYIQTTNSQGFVSLATYDTEAEARKVFDAEGTAYGEWLETEGEDA